MHWMIVKAAEVQGKILFRAGGGGGGKERREGVTQRRNCKKVNLKKSVSDAGKVIADVTVTKALRRRRNSLGGMREKPDRRKCESLH